MSDVRRPHGLQSRSGSRGRAVHGNHASLPTLAAGGDTANLHAMFDEDVWIDREMPRADNARKAASAAH